MCVFIREVRNHDRGLSHAVRTAVSHVHFQAQICNCGRCVLTASEVVLIRVGNSACSCHLHHEWGPKKVFVEGPCSKGVYPTSPNFPGSAFLVGPSHFGLLGCDLQAEFDLFHGLEGLEFAVDGLEFGFHASRS